MSQKQPQGYLALPPAGRGPGILALHAWWGLTPFFRGVCDRLAAQGFTAFAPDLYHGRVAATIPEAEHLVDRLDDQVAREEVAAAAAFLRGHAAAGGAPLGVIGFSLGASLALELSAEAPVDVAAVVAFYGTCPGDYSTARAAYLGHFAETDEYEPAEEVAGLEAALRAAGRPVEFHTYPGTGHWFFESDRPDAYQAEAAGLAWERTLAFLRAALVPPAAA